MSDVFSHRFLVVGMGRLGRTIVRSFGGRVSGVVTSRPDEVRADFPRGVFDCFRNPNDALSGRYDLVWLAVPDRAIGEVASRLAERDDDWSGRIVLHSSGATPLAALDPFRERGARVGVVHPNASLSGDEPFGQGLAWGITLDGLSREWAEDFLATFSPIFIDVTDDVRPLYHAAASVAANYTMVLFESAVSLYRAIGVDAGIAPAIVARFMEEAVRVSASEGIVSGLTGPVARGDLATVKGHLIALGERTPELLDLVIELVRAAVRIMRPEELEKWEEMIQGASAKGQVAMPGRDAGTWRQGDAEKGDTEKG